MPRWASRVLFYGGTLLLVTIMCQGWFKDLCLSLFGDDAGESLFSFIRTNVEAPISIIALAIYLDVVLAHRTRADVTP
jgi:hypothetical protein